MLEREHENDVGARAHLSKVATHEPVQFEHTAVCLREEAAERARLAQMKEEHNVNGFQVHPRLCARRGQSVGQHGHAR